MWAVRTRELEPAVHQEINMRCSEDEVGGASLMGRYDEVDGPNYTRCGRYVPLATTYM
jgi:hypothetical protein